jgi:predicted DNA binding CopG/RHH family protein
MKRLTLDIPESLHKAIKRQAVDAGVTMADLLRDLLEQHYGNKK